MIASSMISGLSGLGLLGGASSAFGLGDLFSGLALLGANAGLNYLGGSASAKASYGYAKKLMYKQYQMNQKYAKEGPSWQVEGYRNAGLNPLLVANAGGADFSSSLPSTPDVNYGSVDLSSAIGLARLQQQKKFQAKQAEAVDSSIAVNRAQENLFKAQDAKASAEAESIGISNAIEGMRLKYIENHPESYFMPSDDSGKALHFIERLFNFDPSLKRAPELQPSNAHEVRNGVVFSRDSGRPIGVKPNKLPKGSTRRERPEEFQKNYRRLLGIPY